MLGYFAGSYFGEYGVSSVTQATPDTTLTYLIEVDWNGDGSFNGTYDNINADVLRCQSRRGRDYASPLTGRSSAGSFEVELLNTSGKYSSFNASSPIYGSILPGRKVRWWITTPFTHVLWAGYLTRIEPQAGGIPTARLSASGPFIRLSDTTGRVSPPAQTGVFTGDVIDAILDAADWPASARDIDTGAVPIDHWFVEDGLAFDLMQEMEETEFGFLREGLDFDVVFEDRYFRTFNSTTSLLSLSDVPTSSYPYEGISQSDPLREIFNAMTATVQAFTVQSIAVLWTLESVPFSIGPGLSITYIAQYPNASSTAGVYVDAWTTPVVGTDIMQTGVADGSIAVSVSKTATKMFITLTNNGVVSSSVSLLQARGTGVISNDPFQVTSSDATSQASYGPREFPLPSPWYPNAAYAQAACDYLVFKYKDPRPILSLTFPSGANTTLLTQACERELSDRITLRADNILTKLGINGDFYIESVAHQWAPGELHRTSWDLSQASAVESFWILGVSALDVDTRLAF